MRQPCYFYSAAKFREPGSIESKTPIVLAPISVKCIDTIASG